MRSALAGGLTVIELTASPTLRPDTRRGPSSGRRGPSGCAEVSAWPPSGTCSALLYGVKSSSTINSLADGTKFRLDIVLDIVSISS